MENRRILIYAEPAGGKVGASYYELLAKTRELFPSGDVRIAAVIAGCEIGGSAEELSESGADTVYVMDSERLAIFNIDYHTEAVVQAVKAFDPDILLTPASGAGEELAPTLGIRLRTGVAAHCVDLKVAEDGQFVQMVPSFGGKVIGEILTPHTRPQIASIKPGMFPDVRQAKKECRIEMLDASALDRLRSKITAKEIVQKEMEGMPLEKAQVIICGGYGTGNAENWKQIEKLAGLLGGAAGCTRPVADQGWVDGEERMIGTSGKTVRPKVYIGTGISGAAHHVCGMKDAGVVISINTDKDAEMFGASDYIAVADGAEVIRELCDLIKNQTQRTFNRLL
jgi:electron transfer flavoprotein alpha subunit